MDENNISIYIWSFHNKFAFGSNKRRKKQLLMIDQTEIRVNAAKVKTHHFFPPLE